jgi:hypothetical protein
MLFLLLAREVDKRATVTNLEMQDLASIETTSKNGKTRIQMGYITRTSMEMELTLSVSIGCSQIANASTAPTR